MGPPYVTRTPAQLREIHIRLEGRARTTTEGGGGGGGGKERNTTINDAQAVDPVSGLLHNRLSQRVLDWTCLDAIDVAPPPLLHIPHPSFF
ncbi:hypothetical protein CVT26_012121 [Gymnopilus dilepis]|uniref:Uncharacterized protein n=1 Tax=Gymnopilus dilepis TaxID=231916 RepID=A0A409YGQ1_9AGAR|nr:hypothetical protein CVT26_012121 [Gymnopilus dilepis]